MPVKLESVVPWGRSLEEYSRIFALSEDDLQKSILDCAGGPSSFNAEMKSRGGRVVSVDPIYELSAEQIESRVEAVRQTMIDQVRQQPEQFVWNFIRSPEHLEELRLGATKLFLQDFSRCGSEDRYRAGGLPNLDFGNGEFPLALCSHFLFLYSDRLDEAFHLAAVKELLRVADDVRIFPVTDLAGKVSKHLDAVRAAFGGELVNVPYEFLKGANEMLRLKR
jgi:hypothetical protein